jgi:NADPH-dependent curcumin reductase CurA
MSTTVSREVHLVRRPHGEPVQEDFAIVESPIVSPAPGQVLIRNEWLSVDPYMRGRMNDVKSYVPPFALGAAMDGGAVGTVLESADESVPVGATVLHMAGWREYATLPAKAVRVIDTELAPATAYLGVLGGTGLTAYVGLTEIAPVKQGDVVFVSGAAGAVGSVAGQVARKLGASKVIGSAGGPEKAKRLTEEFGFDVAIDYRLGGLERRLKEAAPEGIDVYFDNVGGDHLEAAIGVLRNFGRIAWCGAVAQYNSLHNPPPAPRNLYEIVGKSLRLEGFLVARHLDARTEFEEFLVPHVRSGRVIVDETVADGFECTVDAFLGMLRGESTGKALVRVAG